MVERQEYGLRDKLFTTYLIASAFLIYTLIGAICWKNNSLRTHPNINTPIGWSSESYNDFARAHEAVRAHNEAAKAHTEAAQAFFTKHYGNLVRAHTEAAKAHTEAAQAYSKGIQSINLTKSINTFDSNSLKTLEQKTQN